MPVLTGVILARNEEANIVDCATALLPHVGELLLIDMASTDRTVELARPYVTRVLTHPLVPNFDPARNIAIPVARFDWLWFVDADERIPAATGEIVNQLIRERGTEFEALNIPFKSYFCGQWMQHCGWWPGYTMPRVLKRGHFRFADRLHGGVELQGRELRLVPQVEWGVDHFSYRSVEHYLEKINRYTSVEAHQMATENRKWDWRAATRHMVHELWQYYERNAGNLDRERGWILSWLSGQYRWMTHAKLIDVAGPSPDDLSSANYPADLDEFLNLMQDELSIRRAPTPQLPLGVVWRGPVGDPSGYADESRCFLKALAAESRPLSLEEIRWSDKQAVLPVSTTGLLRALSRAQRPKYAAAITNCICTLVTPDPRASLNILRTTFETDRIPAHWHAHLAGFDEIWVISRHNELAFRRSGVAPEKLRVVSSCVDTELYTPTGGDMPLPAALRGRFVFLSVFDWQLRKGWDLLLAAYVRTFSLESGAGLLLKISRAHGPSLAVIREQIDHLLAAQGQSLAARPDLVLWDNDLSEQQMAALYRSVQAFVLPSRGEGWGRPYMEAMASGLPTLGTAASGNIDFMSEENSYLVPARLVDVPESAAAEISVYRDQKWFEPDPELLCRQLQSMVEDEPRRVTVARQGLEDVRGRFGLPTGARAVEVALRAAEERFGSAVIPAPRPEQLRVVLEGEFFAGHSFANVNEHLLREFLADPSLAISALRVFHQAVHDRTVPHAHRLRGALGRDLGAEPQITIRHAFPPNWAQPTQGHWIHIQPWEYGHLPQDWLEPLRQHVDEVWAPSNYVRDVYIASGVQSEKIHVIPWGIEPEVFHPGAPALHLPTRKTFRFLFVGGTIPRKGFDLLLAAYLAEFRRTDDVCLVVKDLGTQTFYRDAHSREDIRRAMADPHGPEIVYLEEFMTAGQLASLYTACHCLAAPYRGEGFGLPILEAMACGLVPIVPLGGPSDDFTDVESAYRLPSRIAECKHSWALCGPATELSIEISVLRAALRRAYMEREQGVEMGLAASRRVHRDFTWRKTSGRMVERMQELVRRAPSPRNLKSMPAPAARNTLPPSTGTSPIHLSAYLVVRNDEAVLADTLSRIRPFVAEVFVDTRQSTDRSRQIAAEYGVRLLDDRELEVWAGMDARASGDNEHNWVVCLHPGEQLGEDGLSNLRQFLATLDPQVAAVALQVGSRGANNASNPARNELRVFRSQGSFFAALAKGRGLQHFLTQHASQQAAASVLVLEDARIHSRAQPSTIGTAEPWLESHVPRAGDIFLDIGANVGTWTKWLAPGYRHVHAIEPNPAALVGLRNNLPRNVSIHEWGAWDREELVRFSQFKLSVHMTAYFADEGINTGSRTGTVELHCRPIDALALNGKVDFIKCDTEGAEVRCLHGARNLIERDRPCLLVECHSTENFGALMKLFSEWRYLVTVIRNPHYKPLSSHWKEHCWFACQPRGAGEVKPSEPS